MPPSLPALLLSDLLTAWQSWIRLSCLHTVAAAFRPVSEHAQTFPDSHTVQLNTNQPTCASVPLSLTLVVPVFS